jgi:hypothetical protein
VNLVELHYISAVVYVEDLVLLVYVLLSAT